MIKGSQPWLFRIFLHQLHIIYNKFVIGNKTIGGKKHFNTAIVVTLSVYTTVRLFYLVCGDDTTSRRVI